ncbi:sodium:solute symporter family protein [Pallidibacillus pasinlerensis]|uniref:Sodium:solute symporter family protein n=1 Tax=Pallidibacillus pasinlerensis TaxID=2703818 RepID=A0ABX0A5Y6_9BACI|nr:sodium:solute symporter family protein [Pallidibacillus pasinlerensis]NCU16597.1 sodium:solute symporter family protein [Pallidibacillus pasinlerensis]
MSMNFVWIGIAIYVVIATIVAFLSKSGKQTTMESYFLSDRKLGGFVSTLSYSATTYSAFMLVGLAGLTYAGGVGALGFELIYLMGVSLVAFFGPRFWFVGKKYGYVTPYEMLGDRYQSKSVSVIVAIASSLFLIPYSAVQLSGIGYLLAGMTDGGISFTTGVLIATVLAIVFSYVAGIRSVAWTDALQALFMIVSATAIVLFVVYRLGGFSGFFGTLETELPDLLTVPGNGFFNIWTFLGLTIPWFFFSLSNPQVSQRLFMPDSLVSLRKMILGFMIFGLIYTLVAIMWGFSSAIAFPDLEKADLATPTLLGSDLVPPALALIVMIGIMAAAISTIDSILLTLSSVFARDVYGNISKESSDKSQLLVGKIVIPIIAVLAYLFAQMEMNLIAVLSVASSAGLLVTVPALIGTFFWKRGTAAGVNASVIITGLLVIYFELSGYKPFGIASGLWAISLSTIIFIVVSLMTKAPKEKANEFLSYLNSEMKNVYESNEKSLKKTG